MPTPGPVSSPDDTSQSLVGRSRITVISAPNEIGGPLNAGLSYDIYSPATFSVIGMTATTTLDRNPPIVVRCDATSGNITVTLPSTASIDNHIWHISKIDSSANTVTVAINTSDTWYGATAAQTLATQWKSVTLISVNDAVNTIAGWHVVATT